MSRLSCACTYVDLSFYISGEFHLRFVPMYIYHILANRSKFVSSKFFRHLDFSPSNICKKPQKAVKTFLAQRVTFGANFTMNLNDKKLLLLFQLV
jgi:hypothetical protein